MPDKSLEKYSYLVYGYKKLDSIRTGTAFFIMDGENMFLVSANHVFSGFDTDGKKDESYPDTMYVNLINNKTNKQYSYPIDIRNHKDKTMGTKWFERADVFVTKIQDFNNYNINPINDLIKPAASSDNLEVISGYGYAYKNANGLEGMLKLTPLEFEGKLIFDIGTKPAYPDHNNVVDEFNFVVNSPKGNWGHGNSGAPVFIYLDSIKQYGFAGLTVAFNPDNGIGVILRVNHILQAIRNYKPD